MIKVLKDGHGEFKEAFCNHCGCEFAYQKWDVDGSIHGDKYWMDIDCPACHKRIHLGKMTIDEWLKNGKDGKLC